MLLDNEKKNCKVHEWISKYTEEGKLDIVTGYFTIRAIAFLSKVSNEKIERFRFILGDIVNVDELKDRALDLMNENISIESALKLSSSAKKAVNFLKQRKVEIKTLEPNFCHAKVYLHKATGDDRHNYFISGSSNLTEAGIGLKTINNMELNIAETGNNTQYKDLVKWFENLWNKPQAHQYKTLKDNKGKIYKEPFKKYLIDEIKRIYIEYTPKDLYYKVLFELFGTQLFFDEDNPEFNRQIERLKNSLIYPSLYKFQQKGVLSLIKMLQKYNGAILADAVGLGKTWSALAVMKFFQLQGREIILICPKKLQHNWARYKKLQNSKFEKDEFDYFVRFHTDLRMELMTKDAYKLERADTLFINDKPKLFVIDESHNLRNDKSNRYKFLVEEILSKNEDVKVLMLSATPINNSLNDIRNQFKLMVGGNKYGFDENLGIKNIDYTFKNAQTVFNEWRSKENPKMSEFIKDLPDNFFKLTDALTMARTRTMINSHGANLFFPKKEKPQNLFVTPKELGNFESFEELFEKFPPMLSAYQPAFYTESLEEKKKRQEKKSVLDDEVQRDKFLVKMMYILMVKRLESSWFSFYSTVKKIANHHENALNKIKLYEKEQKNQNLIDENQSKLFDAEELDNDLIEFTLGKKRKVNLSDIDEAGNLKFYKKDLKKDIDALDNIISNLQRFEKQINKEIESKKLKKSADIKLETLIKIIKQKQASKENNYNKKVIIFTVYKDTADYLFRQLNKRGFKNIGLVSGTGSKTSDNTEKEVKNFEPILERFAPFTKLFKEKEWDFEASSDELNISEQYEEWKNWICENHQETQEKLNNKIDILIATDALSEGQNLQDADMLINYDIHWNPVRIIQRMGRIDRLGSPNKKIFGVNFWPSNNINTYLNLQGRIEQRMASMQLAGSEVQLEFSDTFKEMAKDENMENKMKKKMIEQMQTSWEDIEVNEKNLGFNNLSLEKYRQDLLEEYNTHKEKYTKMPKGVYTGFKASNKICSESGMIALLAYPSKPPKSENHIYKTHDLIYIDKKGETVVLNQKEVLDALALHKEESRFIPEEVDRGEEKDIKELASVMKNWLNKQAVKEEKQADGSTKKKMGIETQKLLLKLQKGDKDAIKRIKENTKSSDKFKVDNFDLITWFLVTK